MKRLVILAVLVAACSQADGSSLSDNTALPQQGRLSPADSAAAEALLAKADQGRIQGDANAKVWIVEVSDFQCPYCKMFHDSTYATIKREFIATGQARMAYVNFPIQSHENAIPAAEAAMCASVQGKFWTMHDELFRTQPSWAGLQNPSAHFESLAKKVGVEIPSWRSCLAGGVMRRLITADRQRGVSAGVNSTPYFFIGDEAIRGAAPAQAFRDAMKKARAKAAAGTKQ
jgi:protein-disulfide isomerase